MPKILLSIFLTCLSIWLMGAAADIQLRPVKVPELRTSLVFFLGPEKVDKKTIKSLRAKVRANSGASSSKAYARLGEAELRYAAAMYLYENEIYYNKLATYINSNSKKAAPKLSHRVSESYLKSSARTLAKAYKKLKRNPKVLYLYGIALSQTGQPLAINVLDELTTSRRRHPYKGKGYTMLGDFYYYNGDQPKSGREYKRAEKFRDTSVKIYMQYRSAWDLFVKGKQTNSQARIKGSIQALSRLVKSTSKMDGDIAVRINDQATADTVGLLADTGDINLARITLKKLGLSDLYNKTLERIAMQKIDSNDAKSAYKIYAMLLKNLRLDKTAPDYAFKLLDIATAWQNAKLIERNLLFIVANYANKESKWLDENDDEKAAKELAKKIEMIVYQYATDYDRLGRDQRSASFLKIAIKLYDRYIKYFPESKRIADVKYYRAQLDYQANRYESTTKQLISILDKHPKYKANQEIAVLAVESAQKLMDSNKNKFDLPPPYKANNEIPIGKVPQMYADTLDLVVKRFPRNADAAAMSYAAANIYFDFGHYDEAMERYAKFLRKNPRAAFTKEVALKLLGYNLIKRNEDEFVDAQKLIKRNPLLRADKQIRPLLTAKISDIPGEDEDEDEDREDEEDEEDKDKEQNDEDREDED